MNELSEADKNRLTRGHCAKCGERGFVLGPQEGAVDQHRVRQLVSRALQRGAARRARHLCRENSRRDRRRPRVAILARKP